MKRHLRIFFLIFQNVLTYRARNFVWFLEALVNPLILMLFWQGAVSSGVLINDWSINDIRSYYLYIMIASVFLMHSVELVVANSDIKNGELEPYLLRPFRYSLFRFYSEAPWRLIQLFYSLIALFILSEFFHLSLSIINDPIRIIFVLIIATMGYILSYLFKMVIAFIAFWLIDIRTIIEINDLLILMLAGQIMPIPFFPPLLQTIANSTPYPYIIYYPAAAFAGLLDQSELLRVIGVQSAWITIFALLYMILWKKGIKIFSGVGK